MKPNHVSIFHDDGTARPRKFAAVLNDLSALLQCDRELSGNIFGTRFHSFNPDGEFSTDFPDISVFPSRTLNNIYVEIVALSFSKMSFQSVGFCQCSNWESACRASVIAANAFQGGSLKNLPIDFNLCPVCDHTFARVSRSKRPSFIYDGIGIVVTCGRCGDWRGQRIGNVINSIEL